ncbi:MAG: alpha/beta fold hydrolase [Anaerolineae bacterium]|nr:alpha/beta fold hydrolase [Anaerolineae bacterium]
MKRHFGLLIAVLLLLALAVPLAAQEEGPPQVGLRPDAPEYALHGPYWVGTRHLPVASTSVHPTRVEVWYPALNPEGLTEDITFREFDLPIIGHALQDAAPDVEHGPYPLVIVAHGLNGNRQDYLYLCEHLASHGFVVLAITYADAWATPAETPFTRTSIHYSRPQDVTWQIDYATSLNAAQGELHGMIDTEKIAVVGHSMGGYTALMAAGAQLDIQGQTSWCTMYPDAVTAEEIGSLNICRELEENLNQLARSVGLETVPDELWPSWGDERVDAIVPLAPAAFEFGSESLQSVTIPTMVMYGSADDFVLSDIPLYETYVYEDLGSPEKLLVVFEHAGHQIYYNDCDAQPWLLDRGLFWVCRDDIWDFDRAHDLINHFTTAFLLDVLKGDEAAHEALAPDAVSFPGLTYEAEGF